MCDDKKCWGFCQQMKLLPSMSPTELTRRNGRWQLAKRNRGPLWPFGAGTDVLWQRFFRWSSGQQGWTLPWSAETRLLPWSLCAFTCRSPRCFCLGLLGHHRPDNTRMSLNISRKRHYFFNFPVTGNVRFWWRIVSTFSPSSQRHEVPMFMSTKSW